MRSIGRLASLEANMYVTGLNELFGCEFWKLGSEKLGYYHCGLIAYIYVW